MSDSGYRAGVIVGALAFLGTYLWTTDPITSVIVTAFVFAAAAGITALRERQRKNRKAQEIDDRMGR